MDASTLTIFAFIFLLAAFIHGSTGFGFPMVATPLLALFSDLQTAIILTLIPTLLVNLVSIASEGNFFHNLHKHLLLALFATIGSAIGTLILIQSQSEIFKALLAFAIIVYLFSEKLPFKLNWVRAYPNYSRLLFGISAGILGGLTNVMAPVLIIFTLESRYSKSDIIKAANLCFLSGKLIQLMMFSAHGFFTVSELTNSSIMLAVTAPALYAGIIIKKKIRLELYKKLLRTLLLMLAIILLVQVSV